MTATAAPHRENALSVVITATQGPRELSSCLEALRNAADAPPEQVVVVLRSGSTDEAGAAGRAGVEVVTVPGERSVQAMRAAGARRVTGRRVAFLDSSYVAARGWVGVARSVAVGSRRLVGGSVGPGSSRARWDRASHLLEYSAFSPSGRPGPRTTVPAANSVWDRALLDASLSLLERPSDALVLRELRHRGVELVFEPALRVHRQAQEPLGRHLADRFCAGRAHAGARLEGAGSLRRLTSCALTPAIVPLSFWRLVRGLPAPRSRFLLEALSLSPWLLLLVGAGALGEGVAAIAGGGAGSEIVR